jgi:hypothetical protein
MAEHYLLDPNNIRTGRTVTGYYLGRVPAELHASSAQQVANAARAEAK